MHVATRFGETTGQSLAAAEQRPPTPVTTGGTMSDRQTRELVGDIAAKHGMSRDRARMLVDRFGLARQTLDGAAHDLAAWRS